MRTAEVTDALAVLLAYPCAETAHGAAAAIDTLRREAPDLLDLLEPHAAWRQGADLREQEEVFTRTFDWSSERALDLGWHLYGEQYERGAFLVRMRELLRSHGIEEGQELPDHLGTVLRLLGRMPESQAQALAEASLRPALARLRAGFGADPNPYLALIATVEAALPAAPAPAVGGSR